MISGVRAADSLHPLQQYSSSYESPMQSPPARDEIVNFKGNSQVSIERTAHKNHLNYPETISSQPERMAGAAGSSMNAAELDSTAFHPGTLYKGLPNVVGVVGERTSDRDDSNLFTPRQDPKVVKIATPPRSISV